MTGTSKFRSRLLGWRLRWLQPGLPQHDDNIGHCCRAPKLGGRLHGGNLTVGVAADHGMDGAVHGFVTGLMMVRFEAGLAVGIAAVMRSHRASASGMIPSSCAMRSILRVVATATTSATPS